MRPFSGFPADKTRLTPVPDPFFRDLLPRIDDLGELKVTLYVFWFFNQQQDAVRYLTREDFLQDARFMDGLSGDPARALAAPDVLDQSLARAVARGTLLKSPARGDGEEVSLYFLNTARGRAALKALESGDWSPDPAARITPALEQEERPVIFRLYEENIGPLTSLIADTLRDAEQTYPPEWIQDAIQIAVENNVRRWRYVEAILKSWQENGRHGTDRQDFEKNREYYLKGDSAGFIER